MISDLTKGEYTEIYVLSTHIPIVFRYMILIEKLGENIEYPIFN